MNISDILLWGFAATVVLTIILSVSKPMGLTRMDLPFILGTLLTPDRNKAPFYGFIVHIFMGWLFAFMYAIIFKSTQNSGWDFGLAIGFLHGVFVLTVGLQLIASFHPRMAQAYRGPTPTRQLEPPGLFALNYGIGTPVTTIIAHLVYGLMLGIFMEI